MPIRDRKTTRSAASQPAPTHLTRRAAPGRYTDVDTLRGSGPRPAVRPGGYTEVDRLSRPQACPVRPGSYVDAHDFRAAVAGPVRAGSYTDTDLAAA